MTRITNKRCYIMLSLSCSPPESPPGESLGWDEQEDHCWALKETIAGLVVRASETSSLSCKLLEEIHDLKRQKLLFEIKLALRERNDRLKEEAMLDNNHKNKDGGHSSSIEMVNTSVQCDLLKGDCDSNEKRLKDDSEKESTCIKTATIHSPKWKDLLAVLSMGFDEQKKSIAALYSDYTSMKQDIAAYIAKTWNDLQLQGHLIKLGVINCHHFSRERSQSSSSSSTCMSHDGASSSAPSAQKMTDVLAAEKMGHPTTTFGYHLAHRQSNASPLTQGLRRLDSSSSSSRVHQKWSPRTSGNVSLTEYPTFLGMSSGNSPSHARSQKVGPMEINWHFDFLSFTREPLTGNHEEALVLSPSFVFLGRVWRVACIKSSGPNQAMTSTVFYDCKLVFVEQLDDHGASPRCSHSLGSVRMHCEFRLRSCLVGKPIIRKLFTDTSVLSEGHDMISKVVGKESYAFFGEDQHVLQESMLKRFVRFGNLDVNVLLSTVQ